MEPHKDMNGNILRVGDYVVKEGNEEVDFQYTGSNNQNDLIERTPFSGIVTHIHSSMNREYHPNTVEVVQSSGDDKVSYIIISVLRPLRLQDYIVPVDEDDNPDIKLRRVNRQEAERAVFRYGSGHVSGEGRRISRTGASTGQSGVEQGGRRKRKRKVRKKRTKKKARLVRSKRKRKKKRRTKRRKN